MDIGDSYSVPDSHACPDCGISCPVMLDVGVDGTTVTCRSVCEEHGVASADYMDGSLTVDALADLARRRPSVGYAVASRGTFRLNDTVMERLQRVP